MSCRWQVYNSLCSAYKAKAHKASAATGPAIVRHGAGFDSTLFTVSGPFMRLFF
jgi:hypothetical protein